MTSYLEITSIVSKKIPQIENEIISLQTELSMCIDRPYPELYTKMYIIDIKHNKLLLFQLKKLFDRTFTIEIEALFLKKMRECMMAKMEVLSELVEVEEIDENFYLEEVNELKDAYEINEHYHNSKFPV